MAKVRSRAFAAVMSICIFSMLLYAQERVRVYKASSFGLGSAGAPWIGNAIRCRANIPGCNAIAGRDFDEVYSVAKADAIEQALKANIKSSNDRITTLQGNISDLSTRNDALTKRIELLEKRIELLENKRTPQ